VRSQHSEEDVALPARADGPGQPHDGSLGTSVQGVPSKHGGARNSSQIPDQKPTSRSTTPSATTRYLRSVNAPR
jgi:hypothetical protein